MSPPSNPTPADSPSMLAQDHVQGAGAEAYARQVAEIAAAVATAESAAEAERLRLLVDQLPIAAHVVDAGGRTVLVNHAFERMFGVGMREFEGYVLWDDPQLAQIGMRPYVERARSGEVVRVPARRVDATVAVGQGAARMVETLVYPVRDASGAMRELVMLSTDVSERLLVEAEMRESERRLREALEIAPQPLLEIDVGGSIVYANAAAERTLGQPRGALVGRRYDAPEWATTTLDGRALAHEELPISRALAGALVRGAEIVAVTSTGARRIFEVHAAPRRDARGDVTGVIAAFEDVTERHAALAERERLLAAERTAREEADRKREHAAFLAEASRLLSASLDYESTLQALAATAVPTLGDWCAVDMLEPPRAPQGTEEASTGWPPRVRRLAVAHQDPARVAWARELERRVPQDWSAPTGLPRVLREGVSEFHPVIDDAMLVAAARDEEHLALLREVSFSSYICVPLVARGQLLGALTLCHTESGRRYDADDLALVEELARRAAVAVDNARLYREAVEANRTKSEFLAVMSHELRTPINAILGYAGLLEAEVAGTVTEGQREFVRRGGDAARRLLGLVDDLLTFARLEAGRVVLRVEPVAAAELVREVVPLVAPQAAIRGVALDVELATHTPATLRVRADRERAAQVLLNLLANALKFTPAGGRVSLDVMEEDDDVSFAVRDTGVGIDPEDLERVFQPFVQLDVGRTRTTGGTGLGLAIARDLARAMNGDVLAVSEPGRGSTFTLVLPRVAADGPGDAPGDAPAGA